MNFYTLQITFGNTDQPETVEFKDLHADPSQTETDWIRQTRHTLFTTGFQRQTAPGTYEFISPLIIYRALLTKQPHKFGV
jgi:hypothetical protein